MVIAGLTGVSRLTTHKGFLQAPKATTSIDGNNTEGSRLHFTMLIDLSCRAKNTNGINKLSQLNSIKIASPSTFTNHSTVSATFTVEAATSPRIDGARDDLSWTLLGNARNEAQCWRQGDESIFETAQALCITDNRNRILLGRDLSNRTLVHLTTL